MLQPAEIAALEEHRLTVSVPEVADRSFVFSADQGGGAMCTGGPGTWANTCVGLGMCGPVPPSVIDHIIEFQSSVGAEPRVEACPHAHPSLLAALAERRFILRDFETVLARPLHPHEHHTPPRPAGVEIVEIAPTDTAAVREYARAVSRGFAAPQAPTPHAIELAERCAAHHRSIVFAAMIDGAIVGAGSLEWLKTDHSALAALYALSVLPDFRRRGIQQALIAARLSAAAKLGCTVATIGSRAGGSTERNARRAGFEVMYTKGILVRPGDGLAPAG